MPAGKGGGAPRLVWRASTGAKNVEAPARKVGVDSGPNARSVFTRLPIWPFSRFAPSPGASESWCDTPVMSVSGACAPPLSPPPDWNFHRPTTPTIAVIKAPRPVRIPGSVVQKARKPPLRSGEGSSGIRGSS